MAWRKGQRVDICRHLWTACVRQLLPGLRTCTGLSLCGGLWPYISWHTCRVPEESDIFKILSTEYHFIFMGQEDAQASVKWIPPSWADSIIVPCLQPRPLALAAISKDVSRPVELGKSPNQPAPLTLGHAGTFFLTQHHDQMIQYNLCYYQACVNLRGKYWKNGFKRSDIQIVPSMLLHAHPIRQWTLRLSSTKISHFKTSYHNSPNL